MATCSTPSCWDRTETVWTKIHPSMWCNRVLVLGEQSWEWRLKKWPTCRHQNTLADSHGRSHVTSVQCSMISCAVVWIPPVVADWLWVNQLTDMCMLQIYVCMCTLKPDSHKHCTPAYFSATSRLSVCTHSFIHFFKINSDKTHCRYRDRTVNSLHSEMLKSQIKMKVQ